MPLLPISTPHGDARRRKPQKRRGRGHSGGYASLSVLFLLYLGYRRAGRAALGGDPAAEDAPGGRRDLQQKDGVLAASGGGVAPQYRGPGQVETFPAPPGAPRLLLATHGRLMWYRCDTEELTILHEGQGVYYGGFPGEARTPEGAPATVWVVSRPHNWRPTKAKEWLLELDAATGKELRREPLPSRFTHDTVRRRDRVYAANTGDGKLLELSFPGMAVLREMALFTAQEHVNTLSPTADGKVWAMLHNLGPVSSRKTSRHT
jgi:hypothetical protein